MGGERERDRQKMIVVGHPQQADEMLIATNHGTLAKVPCTTVSTSSNSSIPHGRPAAQYLPLVVTTQ